MISPVIRTPRLLLDELRIDDSVRITEYCQDPELQAYTTVPAPYTTDHGDSFVTEYAASVVDSAGALWAIRTDGVLAGVIELTPDPPASATVGFWLGAPHRRRGILSEALCAVVEFGFAADGMGLDRLYWEAVVGNVGSARVARGAGFRYEGVGRSAVVLRGIRLDRWSATLLVTDPRGPADGWPV